MLIGSGFEVATWGWAAAAWPAACEIEAVRLSCDDAEDAADDEALVEDPMALWATGADETEAVELALVLAFALDAGLVAALVIGLDTELATELEATALWA